MADDNRLICIGMECPAGQVYQLDSPTERLTGECSSVELVEPSGLRIPPILAHHGLFIQDPSGNRVTSIVFVCPIWPSQPWYPLLLELTCDVPLVLPQSQNLLQSAHRLPHPLVAAKSIWLAAWRLSGTATSAKVFRTKWSDFSWEDSVPLHSLHTNPPGSLGVIGVFDSILIPCQAL